MTRTRIGALVAIAAIAVAVWYWHRKQAAPPAATSPVATSSTPVVTSVAPAATAQPAHVTVLVTDAATKAPLANATVRFAPDDGDVVLAQTGADGTAHAELAAGSIGISAAASGHAPAGASRAWKPGERETVTLALTGGAVELSGLVTDATGGPVVGARVDAAALRGNMMPGDAIASALTGADGGYQLTVAPGAHVVAASSPDYAPQSRIVDAAPPRAKADFALVPGGSIEGIVRDATTKEPVAGAAIDARRDAASAILLAEPAHKRAASGPDGHFRVGGLRPGAWELTAAAGERHTTGPALVGLGVAEQASAVELLVAHGPVIRGRVVDHGGAPVAGATVNAIDSHTGQSEHAEAGTDGHFALVGLPPATYHLRALAEGFVASAPAEIELGARDPAEVTLTIDRGARLAGHVEPRQICDVSLDLAFGAGIGPTMITPPVTTGEDGAFAFDGRRPGKATLHARCPSGAQGTIDADAPADVTLPVTPGGSIAGRVVDSDGKPVAGAVVAAADQAKGDEAVMVNGVLASGAQARTGADGAFEISGLAPSTFRLRVLDRGKPMRAKRPHPQVTLGPAEKKTGVELAVDRPTGVIRGVITGADGTPVADAWVSVHEDMLASLMADMPPEGSGSVTRTIVNDDSGGGGDEVAPALTDASGHYEIDGLPRSVFSVVAEAQKGQLRARRDKITPDATIDLRLAGMTSLVGTAHGPHGPAALFSVELDGPTQASRSFADGAFSFDRVEPGDYTVRVSSSDGNGEAHVTVSANAAASIDVPLVANGVVIGKLVDPSGAPVAGAPVALAPDRGDGNAKVSLSGPPPLSAADGTFRLTAAAGTYIFIALGPMAHKPGVVVQPGATIDLGTLTTAASDGPGPLGDAPHPHAPGSPGSPGSPGAPGSPGSPAAPAPTPLLGGGPDSPGPPSPRAPTVRPRT
ncbi:MAG TPA: carboxypeptidase-like regulatory domain-containing protein [Kofleriaceae bacterium]|jgi:protocatechuate 3,4-dioxygenase beta subunit